MSTTRRALLLAAPVGVAAYVGAWFVLGLVREDYDPLRRAISELYDLGAPRGQATLLAVVLVVVGLALVPFGVLLDDLLPGRGRLGPGLLVVSGLATAAVAFFPCSAGCPGLGASATDTWHVVLAGGGYVALVLAPLATAHRVAPHWPSVARWSRLFGTLATVLFLVRNLGTDVLGGLQQRTFNTIADVWIAYVAVVVLRRHGRSAATATADVASVVPPGTAGSPTAAQRESHHDSRP